MALRLVIHGLVDPRSSSAVGTWYCVRIRTRNSCSHLAMLHHAPRTIAFGTVADVVGALRSRVDAMGWYVCSMRDRFRERKKPNVSIFTGAATNLVRCHFGASSALFTTYHARWQIGSNFQVARPPPQTPLRFKQNSYSCKKSELRLLGDLNFDFTTTLVGYLPSLAFITGFVHPYMSIGMLSPDK